MATTDDNIARRITVTVDMANDLVLSDQGPRYGDSPDADDFAAYEEFHARAKQLEDAWVAAAKRLGESWGFTVDAFGMTAGDPRGTWTSTPVDGVPAAQGHATVEEALWQAAHDATVTAD